MYLSKEQNLRVFIFGNYVSYIFGVGQLLVKYILDDNYGFVCIYGGSGDICFDVFNLNFVVYVIIFQFVINVIWVRVSFVSYWGFDVRVMEGMEYLLNIE